MPYIQIKRRKRKVARKERRKEGNEEGRKEGKGGNQKKRKK